MFPICQIVFSLVEIDKIYMNFKCSSETIENKRIRLEHNQNQFLYADLWSTFSYSQYYSILLLVVALIWLKEWVSFCVISH